MMIHQSEDKRILDWFDIDQTTELFGSVFGKVIVANGPCIEYEGKQVECLTRLFPFSIPEDTVSDMIHFMEEESILTYLIDRYVLPALEQSNDNAKNKTIVIYSASFLLNRFNGDCGVKLRYNVVDNQASMIDWIEFESKGSVAAHIILEAMSKAGIEKFGEFDSRSLEVEMKINGVPVDFPSAAKTIDDQLDDYKSRVKDQVSKDVADEMKDSLTSAIEKQIEEYVEGRYNER